MPVTRPRRTIAEAVRAIAPSFDARERGVSDRMWDARSFLSLGEHELAQSRADANPTRAREACEKIFHALVEACVARVQKYGLDPSSQHREIRQGLTTIGDDYLVQAYDDAFATLHVLAYYQGWSDSTKIDKAVTEVKKAIAHIERQTKR